MSSYRIGEVSRKLDISVDTLRYYEKIGLLPPVDRTASGIRLYHEWDISSLKFIQRAQKMDFSLAEITGLLKMRRDPQHARDEVRQLTANKLAAIDEQLRDLQTLRNELLLLINLCAGSDDGCPIIEEIEDKNP